MGPAEHGTVRSGKSHLIQQLNIRERLRQENEMQEAILQKEKIVARTKFLALLGFALLVLGAAVFFYYNSARRKRANRRLQQAYHDLSAAQA